MPVFLGLETSNPSSASPGSRGGPGVAIHDPDAGWTEVELLRPAHTIAPGRPRSGQGGHDDDLLPAIDRLFRRRHLAPTDIARIYVSIGPGGYTGLRIACAAAKMLAEAAAARTGRPCPCVPVPTALVLARRAPEDAWNPGPGGAEPALGVALASKTESAWVQRLTRSMHGDPGALATAADIPALSALGVCTLIADRFLPVPMRDACAATGITIIEPVFDAAALFELGPATPAPVEPAALNPLYPREPDAVTLWRLRHGTPGGTGSA